nr:uncharacterized protein LOC124817280 [Hydra vulgaris]
MIGEFVSIRRFGALSLPRDVFLTFGIVYSNTNRSRIDYLGEKLQLRCYRRIIYLREKFQHRCYCRLLNSYLNYKKTKRLSLYNRVLSLLFKVTVIRNIYKFISSRPTPDTPRLRPLAEPRESGIEGFILDCQEGPAVVQTKHEDPVEDQETPNKTCGGNIIEISSDEEWVEEDDIACCDNTTRTDRCTELKLDNSENQHTAFGTIKRKPVVTPSIYVQKLIPYVSTLTGKSRNIVEPCTRIASSPHMYWKERRDHQKENSSESGEPSSEHANTSARDVPTLTENGTDITVQPVTRELRLSTLIPLLTTKIVLSTCLSVISYVKAHITF